MGVFDRIKLNDKITHTSFGEGTVTYDCDQFFEVTFDRSNKPKMFVKDERFEKFFIYGYNSTNRIKQIVVKNLFFSNIDYDLRIDTDYNVAIFTAPNGCGKTTVFRLLNFIFNPSLENYKDVDVIPYDEFSCVIDNGYTIKLSRSLMYSGVSKKSKRMLDAHKIFEESFPDNYDFIFSLYKNSQKIESISFFSSYKEDIFDLDNLDNYHMNKIGEVIPRKDDQNFSFFNKIEQILIKNGCMIKLDFIEANRLQKTYHHLNGNEHLVTENYKRYVSERYKYDALNTACKEMAVTIKKVINEYNNLVSEAKDELLNKYLYSQGSGLNNFKDFKNKWLEYHTELKKFYELGFLKSYDSVIELNELEEAYKNKRDFLENYLEVFKATLKPLQYNYHKFKLFADIFHKRNEITNKSIKFSENGIEIFSGNKKIDVNYLSSGEKNDFVMFYRLIFKSVANGVVLIDEPEISLHIEWQEEYLDRLLEICDMNNLQAIVATHSPNIVNGHFDLFIEKR